MVEVHSTMVYGNNQCIDIYETYSKDTRRRLERLARKG